MGNAIVQYKGLAKKDSWVRWMTGRVLRKNQNNLVSIIGKTGSGKTYSGLSIAEKMSSLTGVQFTIDNCVFTLRELMSLINSGKLKRGSVIIFDEPQISISAREFQSQANKVFNFLVSTFRHRNLTLLFCTPFESLLDKNTRKLFHGRFETAGIDSNKKVCILKPRFIEYSDWQEKPYIKQMIVLFKDKDGRKRSEKLYSWEVGLPSKDLIEQYEEKKLAFTTNLNKNIEKSLIDFESKGKSITSIDEIKPHEREPLTDTQRLAMETISKGITFREASKILGIAASSISQSIKYGKKKGYTLEEFNTQGQNSPNIIGKRRDEHDNARDDK